MRNLSVNQKPSPKEFIGKIIFDDGFSHWDSLVKGRLVVGVDANQSLICVRLPIKEIDHSENSFEFHYVVDYDKLSAPIDLSDTEVRTIAGVKAICDTLEEALNIYNHNAAYQAQFHLMLINSRITLKYLNGIDKPDERVWESKEQAIANYAGDIYIPEIG